MTTGRINQVTVLSAGPRATTGRSAAYCCELHSETAAENPAHTTVQPPTHECGRLLTGACRMVDESVQRFYLLAKVTLWFSLSHLTPQETIVQSNRTKRTKGAPAFRRLAVGVSNPCCIQARPLSEREEGADSAGRTHERV